MNWCYLTLSITEGGKLFIFLRMLSWPKEVISEMPIVPGAITPRRDAGKETWL